MKKLGRPTAYSPEFAEEFCERFSRGESFEDAANALGVSPRSISRWLSHHADFSRAMDEARETLGEVLAGRLDRIPDTERDPARARIKYEAAKFRAGCLNRRYRERADLVIESQVSISVALERAKERAGMLASPIIDLEHDAVEFAPRAALTGDMPDLNVADRKLVQTEAHRSVQPAATAVTVEAVDREDVEVVDREDDVEDDAADLDFLKV